MGYEWFLVGLVAVALIIYLVGERRCDRAFDDLCNGIIEESKKPARIKR